MQRRISQRESGTHSNRQTPLELIPSEGISNFTLSITIISYHAYKIGDRRSHQHNLKLRRCCTGYQLSVKCIVVITMLNSIFRQAVLLTCMQWQLHIQSAFTDKVV
jgi:hypothetical protein